MTYSVIVRNFENPDLYAVARAGIVDYNVAKEIAEQLIAVCFGSAYVLIVTDAKL